MVKCITMKWTNNHYHPSGVPSQPTQPLIASWGEDYALLTTTIPRLGSNTSLSLTTLLLENSTMEVARHTQTIEDYEPYTELQVQFPNVSYERLWQFQVFASNYLGDSELSIPSLAGKCLIMATIDLGM